MNLMNRLPRIVTGTILGLLLAFGAAQTWEQLMDVPPGDWPQVGRDVSRLNYSPLNQIDVTNVGELEVVWARDLGYQVGGRPTSMQGSPSVWNGVMYLPTASGILAVNAATGAPIWEYSDPVQDEPNPVSDFPRAANRDIALRGAPVVFDGKVIFNQRRGSMVALDMETGEEVWRVQLTNSDWNEGFTTNPILADGKLIAGPNGADYAGSPGKIMSVDVESGEILWTFDVVPLSLAHPAADTWTNLPSWEKGIGGGSAWNAGAYDPVTRTVLWGTGQPTPWDRIDFRRNDEGEPTSDLYTASFVALDVDTGELKWYHQVVPADEWDYDQHTVPMFADLEIDGESRRVALMATTTGFVVVMDAETGEFIAGHQIHPDPTVHVGYEADGTPIIDDAMRHDGEGDFHRICPGLRWAAIALGAFSPDTGLLYRPNELNCLNYAVAPIRDDWEPGMTALALETGERDDTYWFDRLGGVSAIDPVTGEIVWEWGTLYPHNAGVVATGGNLVFFAAIDNKFRALNATTGEILWEHALTTGSNGQTITYAVDGKQYVATLIGLSSDTSSSHPDGVDLPPGNLGNATVFVFAVPD